MNTAVFSSVDGSRGLLIVVGNVCSTKKCLFVFDVGHLLFPVLLGCAQTMCKSDLFSHKTHQVT